MYAWWTKNGRTDKAKAICTPLIFHFTLSRNVNMVNTFSSFCICISLFLNDVHFHTFSNNRGVIFVFILILDLINTDISPLENSVNPDQLASYETSCSGSTLFSIQL